ncbi:MAG: hypothetical protein SOZ62_02565 [Eubacteriales bacterium]|nr:hypothetical protein [Eubacteriales bacterium]
MKYKKNADSILSAVKSEDIMRAVTRISPLITEERKRDVMWLCCICYLLGYNDGMGD